MIALSIGTLERPAAGEWMVLADDFTAAEFDLESVEEPEPTLAERWSVDDPIDEILLVLNQTGRAHEAAVISRILEDRQEAADHMTMLRAMTPVLAEEWDSSEDDFFDTL